MRALRRWLKRERTIEDRLRDERPQPPEHLVRAIRASIGTGTARRPVLRMRLALGSSALTAAALVGLLAVGGIGYAASTTTNLLSNITSHHFFAKKSTIRTSIVVAAVAQYGTTTTTTTTTATTTTVASSGEVVAQVLPTSSGSVDVTSPGATQPLASVVWTADTFGGSAVVNVNPSPPLVSTTLLLGSGNELLSISVTGANGEPVHALSAPLDIVFHNPGASFVPVISEDGINFRALTKIDGPPLPDSMQDGYYIDSAGDVHILTRHVTIFAVLYKANVTASESGRKFAAPGSGKFGDPTRIHAGAPVLKVVSTPTVAATHVKFTFFVDEQAAAYFHVLSNGKPLVLHPDTSTIRGHRIGGAPDKTLHEVILRPGTIAMNLAVPGAAKGRLTLQLTVVDYDGHKVTRTVKIGG